MDREIMLQIEETTALLCKLLQNSSKKSTINDVELATKKAKVERVHKEKIYNSVKSGWMTLVEDSDYPRGKRKIRKVSEEKLYEALYEHYFSNHDSKMTLKMAFEAYVDWKHVPGRNSDTMKRLLVSWQSYYMKEPLAQDLIYKPLKDISSLMLREFAEAMLRKHAPVDRKKFSRIFRPLAVAFEFASDDDRNIIPTNLWEKSKSKINSDLYYSHIVPPDETQIFTDKERILLHKAVIEDLKKEKSKPTSAGLAVLLLFCTGLRAGELVGLKWSDIYQRNSVMYLRVRRQANNKEVKEYTKTDAGIRDICLTDNALHILELNRQYNEKHGLTAEWIFQSPDPSNDGYRLSYNAAANKLAKLCHKLNIPKRSPYACRKTAISNLFRAGVSLRTIQRFAGHKDIETSRRYYLYDTTSKEEQYAKINSALDMIEIKNIFLGTKIDL